MKKESMKKSFEIAKTPILLFAVLLLTVSAVSAGDIGTTIFSEPTDATYEVGEEIDYFLKVTVCNFSAQLDVTQQMPDGSWETLGTFNPTVAQDECKVKTFDNKYTVTGTEGDQACSVIKAEGTQNGQYALATNGWCNDIESEPQDHPVPMPCCEKPCGSKVWQCDVETVFVLNSVMSSVTIGQAQTDGDFYLDMDGDGIVSEDDIRLTQYHTNYPPNTKVKADEGDIDLDINDKLTTDAGFFAYLDVNKNQKFDLYDPVYVDLNDSWFGTVSEGDIRITASPPFDVSSTGLVAGQYGDNWTEVNWTDGDAEKELHLIDSECSEVSTSDLLGYMDGDGDGEWSCEDKLYLNQNPCTDDDVSSVSSARKDFVTIGDTRMYIPPGDECVKPCGTKVEQGDFDATYVLDNINAVVAYQDGNKDHIYLDITDKGTVSIGDIRLTKIDLPKVSFDPNTKVTYSAEGEQGNKLISFSPNPIKYLDMDESGGYSLADPLYIDKDENGAVNAGDIRLTKSPIFNITEDGAVIVEAGEYGEAWSKVASGDGDIDAPCCPTLETLEDSVKSHLGFIDSDCSGSWTCVDKLYFQQLVEEPNYDELVTIGDHRLYIPPSAMAEGWPDCGSKVKQCDIDLVYVLTKYSAMAKHTEEFGPSGPAYVDMNNNNKIDAGDIRLTSVSVKGEEYPPNTKVMTNDQDTTALSGYMLTTSPGFGEVFYKDFNNNGEYDVYDPIYMNTNNDNEVTPGDIRLSDVPLVDGFRYLGVTYNKGDIGKAWSRVSSGDIDDGFDADADNGCYGIPLQDILWQFDSDCTGDWTCPDKLYLSYVDAVEYDGWGENEMNFVTPADHRLYMPPCEKEDDGNGGSQCACDNPYDANNDCEIGQGELFDAIEDWKVASIGQGELFDVIDLWKAGEDSYCNW